MGASRRERIRALFTGFARALIYSWLGTLGAEYRTTAGPGIGNLLTDGRDHFWMDVVILGVIAIGVVGFALTWITAILESRLLHSRDDSRTRDRR